VPHGFPGIGVLRAADIFDTLKSAPHWAAGQERA
jgi:hypothetical protein